MCVFVTGTGFAMCSTKESHDSDADLDVDGDDTLEYGKAQYPSLKLSRLSAAHTLGCVLMEANIYRLISLT